MKKNLIRLIAIAFAVALLSTFLFYRLLVGRLASGGGETQSIAVAARRLDAGTTLTQADVKIATVAGSVSMKGALVSREQAIGLTAVETIEANAPLTEANAAPRDSKVAAGVRVPPGMRALSIHVVDSTGVVAMLRPGNRVDIHAVGNQNDGAQLRTVLQNVEVLANNAQTDAGQSGRSGSQVVTVLVKAEQSEALALADSAARVRLALRNPTDGAQRATRRLAVSQLFESGFPLSEPVRQAAKTDAAPARRRAVAPPSCPIVAPPPAGATVAKVN